VKQAAHEEFTEFSQVKPPSDRSFGFTVGGILAAIGALRWLIKDPEPFDAKPVLIIGAALVLLAAAAPRLLAVPNRLWMKLGALLARIMNPVIMALMFFAIFWPLALVFRLIGRDALRMRPDRSAGTYWITRDPPGPNPETMTNQF
jgi:Saxitoxin biosynthesis operon protein SxtJ